jgi:hypothetical protein
MVDTKAMALSSIFLSAALLLVVPAVMMVAGQLAMAHVLGSDVAVSDPEAIPVGEASRTEDQLTHAA